MVKSGVSTPKTLFIGSPHDLGDFCENAAKELGFPIVIKRDTGGRGKDIFRAHSIQELSTDLEEKFALAKTEGYLGGFVAQNFIRSTREHDCRIGVVNGLFAFSYKRSLTPYKSDDCWFASTTYGSVASLYEATEEEITESLKSSEAIGAQFNELDIVTTEDGPCVIENNPTPSYYVSDRDDRERMLAFVDILCNSFHSWSI
jgi:glutathione synthase/RimK-type ligase-like ATP-grasp enzyme